MTKLVLEEDDLFREGNCREEQKEQIAIDNEEQDGVYGDDDVGFDDEDVDASDNDDDECYELDDSDDEDGSDNG